MMEEQQERASFWALVELMGRTKIAGEISEFSFAGGTLVRVDVPETKSQPAFTRMYGVSAIYCITPVDESVARVLAENLVARPVAIWLPSTDKLIAAPGSGEEEWEDDAECL
jgi:hypothetical protein